MPSVKTIYLLRHGRVMDASSPKRYIGQTDLQLVKTGIRQARKLAAYFSKAPLDAIACSDLKRSLQTARIIAGNRPVKLEPVCAFLQGYAIQEN